MHFYNWGTPPEDTFDGVELISDRRITEEGGENGWKRELEKNGHLNATITYLKVHTFDGSGDMRKKE